MLEGMRRGTSPPPPRQSLLPAYQIVVVSLAMVALVGIMTVIPMGCESPRPALPFVAGAPIITSDPSSVQIMVRADGIFVGSVATTPQAIAGVLGDYRGVRRVEIHAEGGRSYAEISQIVREARSAGVTDVAFVTFRGGALEARALGSRS